MSISRCQVLSFIAALTIAIACTHSVKQTSGTLSVEPQRQEEPSPFLWRVAKNGRESYLFGTVHAGIDAESELRAVVWQSLSAKSCFVMEVDESSINPQELLTLAMRPDGAHLNSVGPSAGAAINRDDKWARKKAQELAGNRLDLKVSAPAWTKLKARLGPVLGEETLRQLQPWFAAIAYLQTVAPQTSPMDAVLKNKAKRTGKRLYYLENWREAFQAFAQVTNAQDLEDLVMHEEEAKADMQRLIAAYRSGDESELVKALTLAQQHMRGGEARAAATLKVLLNDRNALWLPRLEQFLEQEQAGGCFVAVGAGHLIGTNNLRDLLRARGYKIQRVEQRS